MGSWVPILGCLLMGSPVQIPGCFTSSATWPPGRLPCTFRGTQPTETGHETSHRATAGGRAEVGMDDPQEGGSSVGGVKRHTPRPGGGEQHSSEVSKLRRQTPRQASIGPGPGQRTPRSPTTIVRSLQRAPCCCSIAVPTFRGFADSGLGRARGFHLGLAHDLHDDDGGHPDVSPRSAAAVGFAPSNIKYWMELQRLQRRIQRTLDQIHDPSRQLPARTPTAILEQLRDRIQAVALDMSALNQSCTWNRIPPERLRASQTCRLPTSPHVSSANADTSARRRATSQASETKEEI